MNYARAAEAWRKRMMAAHLISKGYIALPSFFNAQLAGRAHVFCAAECRRPDGAVQLFTNQYDRDSYYALPWVVAAYLHAYDCLLRTPAGFRAMPAYYTALEEVVNLLHNSKEQCLLVSEALLNPGLAKQASVPFTVFRQAACIWLERNHAEQR